MLQQNLDLLEPHNLIPPGVFTLDGLLKYGEEHKQCPYFSARRMVNTLDLRWLRPRTNTLLIDAVLQRYHLLLPLSTRSENRRAGIKGVFKGLHSGL